jgi:hypothetical protein
MIQSMTGNRRFPPPRRNAKRPARQDARASDKSVRHHPLFGDIPLVPIAGSRLDYDLDYRPPMPKGAVRGDVHNQHFCRMCHVPRYFFVDQDRTCVQCHRDFVFSGREQKYWYEELKFHFDSVAIRCAECRRKQRKAVALAADLGRARARLAEDPRDPVRALAVAEALVRQSELTGKGDLDEALAVARQAARSRAVVAGVRAEAQFWEGKAQALRGRHDRATPLFESAREALPTHKRGASLRAEADWHLKSGASS